MRGAEIKRETAETRINISLLIDGEGKADVSTGIGFFDHMMSAFARNALIDITLHCKGDTETDAHHSVEDCGIAMGLAFAEAMRDKTGITRVAHSFVPMDEALAFCALDISGRGHLEYNAPVTAPMIGAYDAQLTKEFLRAFAVNAAVTLNVKCEGENAHHMAEAIFKAVGRALRVAVERDVRVKGIPSTKEVI